MAFALKGAGSATTAWSITANQASLVVTTATTAGAANDLAVLMYAVDNNATVDGDEGAVTGVTDSAGNFWQEAVEFTNGQGTAQTGATNGIWYCNLQNPLAIGATVTLTFSNAASRDASAASLTYFTKAAGFKAAVEGTPGTLANDAANAGSLDVTTANIACLRIRYIASETSVATAITKTAAFTAVLTQAISTGGAATTNQGVRGEYLISTGTSAASAPTGGGGTVDHASVYVAFKETAFTVGDPPHNSDVVGAQVAGLARKAVTAALITASAGLFLPPTPRVADPVPRGWQQALSVAPKVAKAQDGFSFVPSKVARATEIGVPIYVGGGAPRARKVYYQSNFVAPYAPVVAAAPIGIPLNMGDASPRPPPVYYQSRFDAPYAAPVIAAAVSTATAVPLDMGGAGPRQRQTYYQSRFDAPYAPPTVDTVIGIPLDIGGVAPSYRTVFHQSLFQPPFTPQEAPLSERLAVPLDMGGAAPRQRQTYYQSNFVAPYVAPVVAAATPYGWWNGLSTPPSVVTAQLEQWQLPYSVSTVVTVDKWQQPLSIAPAVAKAQQGFTFVPYNTAQLAVNYTSFGWCQPLSTPALVAKAQPGSSFVPYNTAQLAVNYTDFDWYSPLSGAPPVAKARASDWQLPYSVTVTTYGWQSPLSVAPPVAKAKPDFGAVSYSPAQVAVNYTNFGWYQPLSVASPVVKPQVGYSFVPFNTVQLIINYTNFGWYSSLSVAVPVAKAQQGSSFVPYNTAQVVVTYTNFYQQPLSVAVSVARAAEDFGSVPYSTTQADTLEWQQPLSIALPVAKAQTGDWQYPYSVASVVTADEWQQPLWAAPPVAKAQQGFSFVPFDTAQLSVNYTSYGWYQPLSVPARVTPKAAQEGSSSVPYNTPQRFAYSNFGWYAQLSTVARVTPTGQQGLSLVPYNTPQRFTYTNFGWYTSLSVSAKIAIPKQGNTFVPFDTVQTATAVSEDHIVRFIGNVGHFMLR